jgi:tetratricopeptide repeat protein
MANDTTCPNDNCPEDLVAAALFAFGDALPYLDANPARPLENFVEARKAFQRITQLYPNSHLVPLAWGSIGNCSLQLASQDPKEYENAMKAYRAAMTLAADVTTRSLAEFALARALEDQSRDPALGKNPNLLKEAFEHYYNVATEANCHAGERADPLWLEKAGLAAARIAEEQGQWTTALSIYQRLLPVLAPIRQRLEDRINRAQKNLSKE